MSVDQETLRVYQARAGDYASRFASDRPASVLSAFIDALPRGASVLDLGCGPGNFARHMQAAGIAVDPVDASPAMVDLARDAGLPARLGTFDDLDAIDAYHGVWASFSLLHAPRTALPRHFAAIHRALKPQGLLHVGMKLGEGETRDKLGRFYTFVTAEELTELLRANGFAVLTDDRTEDAGLSGQIEKGILILARKTEPAHA